MKREEATQELAEWIKKMKAHGVPHYSAKYKALDIAIEALHATEHDGCEGCKYTHKDQYEMPCLMCKQSKLDLWEESDTE